MKEMPRLISITNNGKGIPIQYILLPISKLQDYFQCSPRKISILYPIEETTIFRIIKLFDLISETKQRLNDFQARALSDGCSLDDMIKIANSIENFTLKEMELKSQLAITLTSVRSGVANESELNILINDYRCVDYLPERILPERGELSENDFAKTFIDMGIKYIGFEDSLDEEILKDFENRAVVFYFKEENKREEPENFQENLNVIHREVQKQLGYQYFAVDCDIHPQLWPEIGMGIQVLENGEVLCENLVEFLAIENMAVANSISGFTDPEIPKPNKSIPLNIPCIGKICDPFATYIWICAKCKATIDYGFDSYFYCFCGRALATSYEFKCPDVRHGYDYQIHEEKYFHDVLSRLKPLKEMNILILGETGVGKSTWINGFANFINFDSLEEAEETEELCSLIPSEFTVCDEDYNEITVSTGTDVNEVHSAGKSATQDCKIYPFLVGDTMIRLIDTPGVGDTRGIEQDEENFQNILSTLSNLEEHGICILLKPNNAKLTVMFRFCIKELLTYLHKDASCNIIFCFTNTRGTFYRPGDTMPALRSLLKEHEDVDIPISSKTIYCFDSESYRFLAAVKNKDHPVNFPKEERENYVKSWEKSINETKRMLDYVRTLSPHNIQSTLNLNHARELIIKLTGPMAVIIKESQIIKENIRIQIEKVKETQENITELGKKVVVHRTEIKFTPVEYPRAICTNAECTTYTEVHKRAVYKVCTDRCKGKDSKFGMRRCKAMDFWGNCKICAHSSKDHMHLSFEIEEVNVAIRDEEVQKMLNRDSSAADIKQRMLENCKKEIEDYNYELKEIENASVEFACFLKQNAITPYNDAMLEYMDHLIKEEKRKKHSNTLEQLESSRSAYEKRIETINKSLSESNIKNPTDIDKLVQHLYSLNRNGKKLQNALAVVKSAQKNTAIYHELVTKTPVSNRKVFNLTDQTPMSK